MIGVTELLIVVVVMAVPIAIVGIIAWAIVASSRSRHRGSQMNGSEARVVQDMARGFAELDKRIESLETILLDRVEKSKEREGKA